MDSKEQKQYSCKSIFKNGNGTPSRQQFTQAWIDLINRMEKSKRILAGKL